MSRPSDNQPAHPSDPSGETFALTEEERELRALYPHVARESTDACRGPEDFLQLAEMGEEHPDNREILRHVLDCTYCMREYREVCRDLRELERLQASPAADPLPAAGQAVVRAEQPEEGLPARSVDQTQSARPSIRPPAPRTSSTEPGRRQWGDEEKPARSWRDWFRLPVLLPALATGAAALLILWFARVEPLMRDVWSARRKTVAEEANSKRFAAEVEAAQVRIAALEKEKQKPLFVNSASGLPQAGPKPIFSGSNTMGGGGTAQNRITGFLPGERAPVVDPAPRVTWEAVPGASSYTVRLYDPAKFTTVYAAGRTFENSFPVVRPLPADHAIFWRVEAYVENNPAPIAIGTGRFRTETQDRRDKFDRGRAASLFQEAKDFQTKGYLEEAAARLRTIPAWSPFYAEAQKRLRTLKAP